MSLTKLDKKYVSEIDQFLVEFDKQHPKRSTSQIQEEQKAVRIARLMKNPDSEKDVKSELWDEF
jgi:hypothetical protein